MALSAESSQLQSGDKLLSGPFLLTENNFFYALHAVSQLLRSLSKIYRYTASDSVDDGHSILEEVLMALCS